MAPDTSLKWTREGKVPVPDKASDKVTLFDRAALLICGAVIGYLSGLALGWASFLFFGAVAGLFGPRLSVGTIFFYDLPLAIMGISAIGCAALPKQTATFVTSIWRVVVALSRRF